MKKQTRTLSKNEEKKSTYKKYFDYKADEIICATCGAPEPKSDLCTGCDDIFIPMYKSVFDNRKMEEGQFYF